MESQDIVVDRLVRSYLADAVNRRQFLKGALAAGLSLSAASAILAACGSANSPSPASSTGGAGGSAAPSAAPSAEATPKIGGTFREGYDRVFTAMKPDAPWDDPAWEALAEPLVRPDVNGVMQPSLAESWQASADVSTWTFKVRKGLKFHSGAPCGPAEVAAYLDYQRNGAFVPFMSRITSITSDADNVIFQTTGSFYAIMDFVLSPAFANVMNIAMVKSAGTDYGAKTFDGTGPFTLAEFQPNDHVLLNRWEDYPGSVLPWLQNKGKAYLASIRQVAIVEAANRANELLAGNVDAVKRPLFQDLAALQADASTVTIEAQEDSVLIFGLNQTKTKLGFDDLKVRQAISHAIDREALVKTALLGHGAALYGPFPTKYPFYEPGVEKFNQYDLALAQQMLDEAGWTKGPDGVRVKNGTQMAFTIVNQADDVRNAAGQALVGMLQAAGIAAKMQNVETGAFFSDIGGSDAFFFQWLWDSPGPLVWQLSHSKTRPAPNWAMANQPDVDGALDAWTASKDQNEMVAQLKYLQLTFAEQLPYLSLYAPNVVYAHNKRVHGYHPTPTIIYPLYNDVWIE